MIFINLSGEKAFVRKKKFQIDINVVFIATVYLPFVKIVNFFPLLYNP